MFFCFIFNCFANAFNNKPDSSRDLITLIISFISSLQTINVVVPHPEIFLWIAVSVDDAAGINFNDIKTLLPNRLSTFPIKRQSSF